MKKAILTIVPFFIIGCGGGSNGLDKIDIKPLVENKTFYEDNRCNTPEFRSFTITSDSLTIKSYNDADYSDLNTTTVYPLISFDGKKREMIIKIDGDKFSCATGYEVTDEPNVVVLQLDCVNIDNEQSTDMLFAIAHETKEEAINNVNVCNR